ncbi:hypothetical protein [Micromonospora siamensis]|uniref:hypothetical protein n=1 Tax=Micromonospora siamensis TaxID=299152 RepID=UPI001E38DC93|nr:hypothetical protein [Micromonospora siamensis]
MHQRHGIAHPTQVRHHLGLDAYVAAAAVAAQHAIRAQGVHVGVPAGGQRGGVGDGIGHRSTVATREPPG